MHLVGRELSDSRFQIDAIDGLRGMAVLLVFLSHTSNQGYLLLPFLNLAGIGKEGVYLFFFLSSFLLTIPFVEEGNKYFTFRNIANYCVRRFFRIYPLYIVFVVFNWLVTNYGALLIGLNSRVGLPYILSDEDVLNHLMLQEAVGVSWSILVECRYYVLLPVVAYFYFRLTQFKLRITVLSAILLPIVAQAVWGLSKLSEPDWVLGPYLGIFLLGAGLAAVHSRIGRRQVMQRSIIKMAMDIVGIFCVLGLICLVPSVASKLIGCQLPLDYFHKQYLVFAGLWGGVVLATLYGAGSFRLIFESMFLRYLGFISFSLYFFHTTAVSLVKIFFPAVPFAAWIMLIISLLISHLSWLFIEKPSAKVRLIGPIPCAK